MDIDICGEVKDVWAKWYHIGVGLKVPTKDLDDISKCNNRRCEHCFRVSL